MNVVATAQFAKYPYDYLLEQQQEQLEMLRTYQRQEIEQVDGFKNHQLPLLTSKKIMKDGKDICVIFVEAQILFNKACELFILYVTIHSRLHAEKISNKLCRRTTSPRRFCKLTFSTSFFDVDHKEEPADLAPALQCNWYSFLLSIRDVIFLQSTSLILLSMKPGTNDDIQKEEFTCLGKLNWCFNRYHADILVSFYDLLDVGKGKMVVLEIVNLLDFLELVGLEHLRLLLLLLKEMVVWGPSHDFLSAIA